MKQWYQSFLANSVAATALTVVIILLGSYHLLTIEREIFPDFAPPRIQVVVEVRGTTAKQLEPSVLVPIERSVKGLKGVTRIESFARDGEAEVLIELDHNASVPELQGIIKSRVDSIDTFPEDLDTLVVQAEDRRSQVMRVNLVSDNQAQLPELSRLAKEILPAIEAIPSVGKVEIQGEPAQILEIEVSLATLKTYGLSFADIAEQVAAHNVDIDSGAILGRERDFRVVVNNQTSDATQIGQIPISIPGSTDTVLLGDIASIGQGYAQREPITRFEGVNAIGFSIFRVEPSNPTKVANDVRNKLDQLQQNLPTGFKLVTWLDESRELSSRTRLLSNNAMLGMILVFLSLALFVHWRVAMWVFIGLPVTYLGGLSLMGAPMFDLSINVVTLFGFLIVSGILVDDALIVGESIHNSVAKASSSTGSVMDSVYAGVERVAAPAIFGVLTTIAAFFPLTMLDGDLGHSLGAIATVIILCLLVSIFESKLLLPAHLYKSLSGKQATVHHSAGHLSSVGERLMNGLLDRYSRLLNRCLESPGQFISYGCAVLILTIGLVSSNTIKTIMIPEVADFELEAELQVPVGAAKDEVDSVVRSIEQAQRVTNEHFLAEYELDYDPTGYSYSVSESPTRVSIFTELNPRNDNPVKLGEYVATWRSHLPDLPMGYYFHLSSSAEPDEGINVQLEGNDQSVLIAASDELKGVLATYPGVTDVRDNMDSSRPENQVSLSDLAVNRGIALADVSHTLRDGLLGLEINKVQTQTGEVSLRLQYPEEERRDFNALMQMPYWVGEHESIPLGDLVEMKSTDSLGVIRRANGARVINIYASNDDSILSAEAVMDNLEDTYLGTLTERYDNLSYRIEGEAAEADETSASLVVAALLAIVSVYALLSLPLRSFKTPFLVLTVLPFGIAIIILAHGVFGLPISLPSLFGVIALTGVLVNDSLILVHQFTNGGELAMKAKSSELKERLRRACRNRFRPIVITSITTFCGIMPIMLETDPEAMWLVPIAISLGIGVLFGTFITLLLLPCLILVLGALPEAKKSPEGERDFFENSVATPDREALLPN